VNYLGKAAFASFGRDEIAKRKSQIAMKSDLTPSFEFTATLTLHLVLDDVVPYLKPVFRRLLLEDVGSAVRTWTQYYITFYGRNLRIFTIS
jgi:hypothetical protein